MYRKIVSFILIFIFSFALIPNFLPKIVFANQPELQAPWKGIAIISQGTHNNSHTHNDAGRCAYAIDVQNADGVEKFPVYASYTGKIIWKKHHTNLNGSLGYGNLIIIEHNEGDFYTIYGHLSEFDDGIDLYSNDKEKGTVVKGQKIGLAGKTGNAYDINHLHFQVASKDNYWFSVGIENMKLKDITKGETEFHPYSDSGMKYSLENSKIKGHQFQSSLDLIDSPGCSKPLDVVIAFDRSGSMVESSGSTTKIDAAKFAVKTFIDCLNKSTDRIGLVSFSTTATLDCSLIQSADLKSIVDKYTADGNTNMGAALNLAITELNANGRSGAFRVIIYFTDGQRNIGPSKSQILSTISTSGIKVFTIGYGSNVDESFLKQVASASGGEYYFAPDNKTLRQIYLKLSQNSTGWISKASFTGIINPGETITVGTVNIPWGSSFWKFLLSWPGSDLDLILIDPNGIQVLSGGNVFFSGDTNPEFYDIQQPMPGIWTIKVYGKVLSAPEDYDVEVFEHGAVLEVDPSIADVYGDFSVDIKVNTYTEAINAVKAYLSFPPDKFEVVNVDYSHSFLTSWIEQENDNINGTIHLQGTLPDPGFNGIGLIATVTLRPKILGRGNLSFDSSCFVLRNGDGLDILSTTINGSYNYSILLISPLDMSTIYTVNPTFQWTNISGADLYQLNIENLSGLVYDNNLISLNTLALPTGLFFNNNTYFWKVRAHDVNGWSDWSDVWSFNVTTQLTIDSSAEAGGTILPLGGVLVDYGDSKEFTIIADPMFLINKVLIDGSAVPISHPKIMVYKFTNITTNHTISAEFIHSSPILDLSIETNKTTFKQGDDILYKVYIYNTGNADSTDTTFNVNFPFEIKYDKTDKYFASVQPNGEVMINIGNVTPGTHTFQINAHISTSITQEKSVTTIFDLKSKETDTLRKIINSLLTPNRTGSPGDAGTISVTFLNTKTDPETGERYIDQTNELEMQLGFYGFTSPCDIKINWGDGETETITKTKETLMICKHKYSAKGTMVIQITITDATGKTKTVTAKIKVR